LWVYLLIFSVFRSIGESATTPSDQERTNLTLVLVKRLRLRVVTDSLPKKKKLVNGYKLEHIHVGLFVLEFCPMSRRKSAKKAAREPKKKGRRGWATDEQEAFLRSQIPSFLSSKSANLRGDFWPPLWEQYFDRWPVPNAVVECEGSSNGEGEDMNMVAADAPTKPSALAQKKKVRHS
jgi:hypothetical protein